MDDKECEWTRQIGDYVGRLTKKIETIRNVWVMGKMTKKIREIITNCTGMTDTGVGRDERS